MVATSRSWGRAPSGRIRRARMRKRPTTRASCLSPSPVGVELSRAATLLALAALSALSACGGSNDDVTASAPAQIGTLAYVDTTCEEGGGSFRARQELRIRRGEEERTAVALDFPDQPSQGLCGVFGATRSGFGSSTYLGFERISVSPDGERVVFEITDDFSLYPGLLRPDEEGIFCVASDAGGLRRLAPPSGYPSFDLHGTSTVP